MVLAALIDHLVGGGEQRRRNIKVERLGGLQIDNQRDFCRLFDRQVGRLFAFEDTIHIAGCASVLIGGIGPV